MKDTKPTAKAAITVVSTPPLTAAAPRPGGSSPRRSGPARAAAGRRARRASCALREEPGKVLVQPRLRDGEAPQRRDAALAVDQERLRIAGHAEVAAVRAVAVAHAGERRLGLLEEVDRL